MLEPDTTIELVSRELFVLRKTGSEWRIADYMFNHPERAASKRRGTGGRRGRAATTSRLWQRSASR